MAHLYFGRNEECGLRCVYHGWKFDADGNCVDMPSEPDESSYKDKIKITSYPALVQGGIVWVYMGPAEHKPHLPNFEWSRLSANQRTATKRIQQCNWAQAVEGGIDSSHISFLHNRTAKQTSPVDAVTGNKYHAQDRHPVFEVKEKDAGLLIAARRNAEPGHYYWRVTQFLLPFYTMIPPVGNFRDSSQAPYDGHAWVPIDDHTTWTWSFGVHPHRAFTSEEADFRGGPNGMWGPIDENYMPIRNKANDYMLDRNKQRHVNFTGIDGIPNQDAAVQESMGFITDRTREHLGTSDRAIVNFRRLMLRLAQDLADGKEPSAAKRAEDYNVRSVSVIAEAGIPFEQAAAPFMSGHKT
jgi:phenylpropionate dioxygenase-like ring-hydroxylating dioxygenase large terminal subunit